ncbi:MAG: RnfABCDGE type electron transport complex subunit B [Betaproteobacteria bacterium]
MPHSAPAKFSKRLPLRDGKMRFMVHTVCTTVPISASSTMSTAILSVPSAISSLSDRIDALLPQTQCARCGFAACRPYADALAQGTTELNRCPPGGTALITALAMLTGRNPRPIAPECGPTTPFMVAVIDEAVCIGCTLCIQACPVDAILGAQKRMHTVLPSLCSGCELCVAPCPVDCITLQGVDRVWTTENATQARERFAGRAARLARGERVARPAATPNTTAGATPGATPATTRASVPDPTLASSDAHDRAHRQSAVAAALARARARRGAVPTENS